MPALCQSVRCACASVPAEVRLDWESLSAAELEVVRGVRACLGDAVFDTIPTDLLICFVRGCAHEADCLSVVCERLVAAIAWRAELRADDAVAAPPPERGAFEQLYEAGPVGFDADGRPIILERLGRLPIGRLLAHFDERELEAHAVYGMESARALCRQASHRRGRRIYKAIWIVDAMGMGLAHAHPRCMRVLDRLANCYPEMVARVYVINTPPLLGLLWAMGSLLTARFARKVRSARRTLRSQSITPAHPIPQHPTPPKPLTHSSPQSTLVPSPPSPHSSQPRRLNPAPNPSQVTLLGGERDYTRVFKDLGLRFHYPITGASLRHLNQ